MNLTMASAAFANQGREKLALLTQILLVVAGSMLIALASKIQVPFHPVPMTLQSLVVLTIGLAYGRNLALATVVLYLVEGALGLPVFADTPAKGIGLTYMLGGTGGYLIGFVFAATACGWLAERGWDRHIPTTAAALCLGAGLIYAPGLLWLGFLYGWDKPIIEWGLTPFVFGELTKIALGSCLMPALWWWTGMRKR